MSLSFSKPSPLFSASKLAAPRKAYNLVKDQVEEMVEMWYGVVAENPVCSPT